MLYVYPNSKVNMYLTKAIQYTMQPDCLENDIIRKALEDVEDIYKIEGLAMYSKNHGVKSPASLSGGIKALILGYYQSEGKYNEIIASANMGDNVGKYLQELSLSRDIYISWNSYLPMDWREPILAKDMSNGLVVNNVKDFQYKIGWKGGEPSIPSTRVDFGDYRDEGGIYYVL